MPPLYSRMHWCLGALLCLVILQKPAFADQPGALTTSRSYSFSDVLTLSMFGGDVPAFTPLPIWDWTKGWLDPWIPPPNGELHMQRGGWVNTDSGFFSRELDPAFTFNAGTSGSRDEYIGAVTLFLPLNRRLQIGLSMPFVDSLQRSDGLPAETSFGDVIVAPQLMLDETETRSISAILAIRTPTGQTSTGNGKTVLTPTIAIWQDLPDHWQVRGGIGTDFATQGG
jgi:outer membrane putative beta-barrel porin/alpha-amylase